MLLKGMFSAAIRTDEREIAAVEGTPFPEEEIAMAGAIARRRHEFATGRACARDAIGQLGRPPMPLPMGRDRAPLWPDGLVGSISHSRSHCAAAAALRSDGFLALGLDIEEAEPLDEDFAEEICTPQERAWLAGQPSHHRGLLLKALFSAKECAYKCQYALSGALLDFQDLAVDMDLGEERFTAHFLRDVPPFRRGDRLAGRIRLRSAHIVSAMSIA
ncbi:4'-phosphopantetheinyl transferase family protein [Shinella zoogloeoides]|uniref:4'-phosphopantetheinyl transferase family protein n=1 Tax=Shinella zoogloeoides TaxID=352475 RepID=UPI00273DAA96|nr:4'-phosphopantetheinyl transferase superfamily protein [Shinella zoogloeoides]WLR94988.1 4'-phosphopantetheinyl transferase superfamily protein [Shinella zoogloeoides]